MNYPESEPPAVIQRVLTPRGEIQLQSRGEHYEIISNGTFLMATYNGDSERLLVRAALKASHKPKHILIGGLGVGYSLAEALDYPGVERVTVVEIEEKIIEWYRSYFSNFSDNALDNPKTKLIHADLIKWLTKTRKKYDVICLDIDNGPAWVVSEDNNFLYDDVGLNALSQILNRNGVISFWSSFSSPEFGQRLEKHFSSIEKLSMSRDRGEPDYIYLVR